MTDSNKAAFENLIDQLKEENIILSSAKRYIATNDDEKNWLQKAKIVNSINILPNVRALLLEFESEFFFILIGVNVQSTNIDNLILEDYPINAGLITLLLSERLIMLNTSINFSEFSNDIMFQYKDVSYKGNDYEELLRFLDSVQIFKLPENSILNNEDICRILLYVYSNNPKLLILKFQPTVLNTISEISLAGSDQISFDVMFLSLLSTNFKHVFLELYRLVERLFPINYLKDFHIKVDTRLSFLEFTSELENITSWRPREEDAIEKIFSTSSNSIKFFYKDFFDSSASLQMQSDYKYFYKLRNSIVHFRSNHEEFELNDIQWNLIINATLYLIDEQYSLYSKTLRT